MASLHRWTGHRTFSRVTEAYLSLSRWEDCLSGLKSGLRTLWAEDSTLQEMCTIHKNTMRLPKEWLTLVLSVWTIFTVMTPTLITMSSSVTLLSLQGLWTSHVSGNSEILNTMSCSISTGGAFTFALTVLKNTDCKETDWTKLVMEKQFWKHEWSQNINGYNFFFTDIYQLRIT